MKVRVLQRLNGDNTWFDDAYAYENEAGEVVFRYNLTWEQVGANCYQKIHETNTPLEEIETIIPFGPGQRWLPVEEIVDEEAATHLETLDKACDIPKPRKISLASLVAA